jgi:pimeloyl-ACP methyl ester carboxylesterase
VREASVVLEAARLVRRCTTVCRRRHATTYGASTVEQLDADPVLLVPGFMAGDYTLGLMSVHLRSQGYRTYRSRIRSNSGCLAETADRLERRVEDIASGRGGRVTLVGHSLGGLLAKGLAARRPDLVSGVVTMGSPLLAPSAVHPMLLVNVSLLLSLQRAGFSRFMGVDCTAGECARVMWEEAQQPMPRGLPFTSVYSRRDGIMDWRACLDPAATHVEVRTSHLGMAIDPGVFDVVTTALADVRARRLRRKLRVARTTAS